MADQLTGLGGKELLLIYPEWSNVPKADFQVSRRLFRFPGTVEEVINYSDERPAKFDLGFKFFTKAEEYQFLEFVTDRLGRWGGFWLPAPATFFTLADDFQATELQIKIVKQGIVERFQGFERVFFLTKDGDIKTYQINSVESGPSADQETLNVGAAASERIKPEDVVIFTLLLFGRFDKDRFQFIYETDIENQITTQFMELVKEYPA